MSKNKRPGVQAGMNLATACSTDVDLWLSIERHGQERLMKDIPGLREAENTLLSYHNKTVFTKTELDHILTWKFTVGKNRAFNRKLLHANSNESVQQYTRQAVTLAKQLNTSTSNAAAATAPPPKKHAKQQQQQQQKQSLSFLPQITQALNELEQLKGVGPATSSAVLALIQPTHFCFMYDEVIDCFEKQRDYKLSTYLRVNDQCHALAQSLNKNETTATSSSTDETKPSWTTQRVAKVLWIACRYNAMYDQDLTKHPVRSDKMHQQDDQDDDGASSEDSLEQAGHKKQSKVDGEGVNRKRTRTITTTTTAAKKLARNKQRTR